MGQITRFNLRHARSVITVTRELREYLLGVGVKDTAVIPNGVDSRALQPLSMSESKSSLGLRGTVLGYVGSLEHWVDLEMVIAALPHLNATLLVVGPGLLPIMARDKEDGRGSGVAERVVFTGAVPYNELSRYISAMDIGLNPLKMMKKNEYAAGERSSTTWPAGGRSCPAGWSH